MSDFNGFYCEATKMMNKYTKEWESAYVLKDREKMVGIFNSLEAAETFWNTVYILDRNSFYLLIDKWLPKEEGYGSVY
jgi:hypothetical protein